jgi:hypothetical protein
MSTQDFEGGIEELREVLVPFRRRMSTRGAPIEPPMRTLMASRVVRAIDEGLAILEPECARRSPAAHPPGDVVRVGGLEPIERDLDREEHPLLRWLLVTYWVVLCNFDGISANLEPLAASNLDELTWLVAGALWIQWESGQPTAHQLRDALSRIRARHTGFDAHVTAALAGPPGATRETASIIERLLTDPAATLPGPGVPSAGFVGR